MCAFDVYVHILTLGRDVRGRKTTVQYRHGMQTVSGARNEVHASRSAKGSAQCLICGARTRSNTHALPVVHGWRAAGRTRPGA